MTYILYIKLLKKLIYLIRYIYKNKKDIHIYLSYFYYYFQLLLLIIISQLQHYLHDSIANIQLDDRFPNAASFAAPLVYLKPQSSY